MAIEYTTKRGKSVLVQITQNFVTVTDTKPAENPLSTRSASAIARHHAGTGVSLSGGGGGPNHKAYTFYRTK